ncbi:MAG: hypothetical protein WCK47_09930 [bacterium]|nr:hypothetical protein [Candidatus Sumerlaeota bacterium]
METRCPGNDASRWKPEDICFTKCHECGAEVEIWKDEPVRACPSCACFVHNPRLMPDCEKWCPSADTCPGAQMKQNANRENKQGG